MINVSLASWSCHFANDRLYGHDWFRTIGNGRANTHASAQTTPNDSSSSVGASGSAHGNRGHYGYAA